MRLALIAACACLFASHVALALPLEGRRLANDWLFAKGDGPEPATPPGDSAGWTAVTVPHTWNAFDAQSGAGTDPMSRTGYYRGPAWYKNDIDIPALNDGGRAYLRFEAVSTVADVYLNGRHLGTHLGGFNAFAFEITPWLRPGKNTLLVRADNSFRPDLIPLSGDFPVYGGIYRPVHLIVKPATSFTLLDRGGCGIDIDQTSVSADRAILRVTATIDTAIPKDARTTLHLTLRDATGRPVAAAMAIAEPKPGAPASVSREIAVDHPRLWQGADDPYLYTLDAELYDANAGPDAQPALLDRQTWPVGFRWFHIDPEHGFFLNGKPWKLRGVNRHQDRLDKGWAVSDADHAEDIRLITEMGANAVRLAHYPQSDTFYEMCLRAGLLVWAELPLVDTIGKPADPGLPETTILQLDELIHQRRNFSNIFTWSLGNELGHRPGDDPAGLLARLHQVARKLDPFRPTTFATNQDDARLATATDTFGFNNYPGWYGDDPGLMARVLDDYNTLGGKRGVAVSEYGAGASIRQHESGMTKPPKPDGPWHPEEWQAIVHEKNYADIAAADYCWGSFVWNMFDFASVWRHEGDTIGLNDKGLVTYDRQTRKDAFYFYKANWSREPVLYITSRRHARRTDAQTEVKVYANAPGEVMLKINGREIGPARPDAFRIARWTGVTLAPGDNKVEVSARVDGRELSDSCVWTLTAAAAIAPR